MRASLLTSTLLLLTILYITSSKDVPVSLQSTEEAIINLNEENFEQLVDIGRSERWFVMFHVGCPSCQELYPIWHNFTKSHRGIRLGSLNATTYPNIATRYGIKSFPSFVFFDEGKMEVYQGENTVEAWNIFISGKKGAQNVNRTISDVTPQEDHIIELDRNNFDNFVLAPVTKPWFIMFHTHCPECQAAFPAWHEFARSRKEEPNIGMVDCDKNPELAQRFDVKSYPTFIYFQDGEEQIFNGERRVKEWSQYVDQKKNKDLAAETPVVNITNSTADVAQAPNIETPSAPNPTSEASNGEAPSTEDTVFELTQDNFNALVNSENSGPWFIMFYAPWCPHCQRASPIWKEFGNTRREGVKVGMVDCVAHPGLAGKHNIQGFPTFMYFAAGKTEVFNGDRSIQAWSQFADLKKSTGIVEASAPESIEGSDDAAVHLTKENFDTLVNSGDSPSWFIMFYAPWCPHCQHATPIWKDLARDKKDGARIGMVNCVEQSELQGRYGISGFPTFMFFDHGKTEIFNGPRTVEAWSQFIDQKRRPEEALNNFDETPALEGKQFPQVDGSEKPINQADETRTGEQFAVQAGASSPELPQDRPASEITERLPKPTIGNLNALNSTTSKVIESSIGGLNALNRTSQVEETPITTIAYARPAAGETETRPGITVETMDDRPNEGRSTDSTVHYKEPMLVIGVVSALLLSSFFLFMCYQQLRGKYTAIDTMDRDVEAAHGDNSTVKRDSFSNSMRFSVPLED